MTILHCFLFTSMLRRLRLVVNNKRRCIFIFCQLQSLTYVVRVQTRHFCWRKGKCAKRYVLALNVTSLDVTTFNLLPDLSTNFLTSLQQAEDVTCQTSEIIKRKQKLWTMKKHDVSGFHLRDQLPSSHSIRIIAFKIAFIPFHFYKHVSIFVLYLKDHSAADDVSENNYLEKSLIWQTWQA